jgi:hypothetical protein
VPEERTVDPSSIETTDHPITGHPTADRLTSDQVTSDHLAGGGWWLASDGRWYPPELAPGRFAVPTASSVATEPTTMGSPIVAPPSSGPDPAMDHAPHEPAVRRARRRVRRLVAVVLVVALALGALVLVRRQAGPTPQPDVPGDYIAEKAAELHDDPAAIVDFVEHQVGRDDYAGSLRGPVGTLWAGSGNDIDRAELLDALLDHTGASHHLVRGAGTWAERVDDGSGARVIGRSDVTGPWSDAVPGDDDRQVLTITVRTVDGDGASTDEQLGSFPTADLSAHDIVASYSVDGSGAHLSLAGPGVSAVSHADASRARSQALLLHIAVPGGPSVDRERELFTTAYEHYPSLFDPSNRYDITVSTGWVPGSVNAREAGDATRQRSGAPTPDGFDAVDHLVAYAFLTGSDASERAVLRQQHQDAHLTTPRVTIVSNEADHERPGARSVALDLLKDDLAVASSPQDVVAVNTTHSLYDTSLEAQAIHDVTGEQTQSAADSLATALQGGRSTVPERSVVLAQSVQRLLTDPVGDRASFAVWPDSLPDDTVTFTRRGDRVQVSMSAAVQQGVSASTDAEVRWLASSPQLATEDDVVRATGAAEIVLATAGHLPIDWTADHRFTPSPQWYADLTQFRHGDPVQQLQISLHPQLQIGVLPYYAGNTPPPDRGPTSDDLTELTISDADLEGATSIQETFPDGGMTTDGQVIDMISRKMYRELKATGSTVVTFRYIDGTESDPVRLYVVRSTTESFPRDGQQVEVPTLDLNGDFVKNGSPRPSAPDSGPDIVDPGNTVAGSINKFRVLDDPDYPFQVAMFDGGDNQTSAAGSVTTSGGAPVAGATVTVVEPDASTTSWADGSFALPAFKQEAGTFEVKVTAPGFEPLDTHIDFTAPGAVPLKLQLQPATPVEPTVVTAADADEALGRLELLDRSRDLIKATVDADHDVAVIVPGQHVATPFGPIDGWMVVNRRTGEMYPMFPDGLHGASTVRDLLGTAGNVAKDAAGKGLDWAKDKFDDWLKKNMDTPFDPEKAAGEVPLAFFAGHLAGWYDFAAGALTGVAANIADPSLTICNLHTIAVRTAVALVDGNWYKSAADKGLTAVLEKAYDPPSSPWLNDQVRDLSFKAGALSAIAALSAATKHDWGLDGTTC